MSVGGFGAYSANSVETRMDNRGRYYAYIFGKILKTQTGRERVFKSRESAARAANAAIRALSAQAAKVQL